MKRIAPYLALLIGILIVVASWRPVRPKSGDFDLSSFDRIPVLVGGRIKPIDTVARNSLLILSGKQTLRLEDRSKMRASRWLADVLFAPDKADLHRVFDIANPDLLGMFGWGDQNRRRCSYSELKPHIPKIDEEGKRAGDVEAAQRTPYQTAVFNLRNSIYLYQRLANSIHDVGTTDFAREIQTYAEAVAGRVEEMQAGGAEVDKQRLAMLRGAAARYERQADFAYMLVVAPPAGGRAEDWLTTGAALTRVKSPDLIPASVAAFADMGDAFRAGDADRFARVTGEYAGWLNIEHPEWSARTTFELLFNHIAPFQGSMTLYVMAFLAACFSWLACPAGLRKTAFLLLLAAFVLHTFGMFARMYIQGRPPVTNLYSSAIFVGWGAVLIGLVLERIFRDGIGAASSGLVGFATLIIAHHLGSNGDTLEMMQAVLDSNFWLATHVVVITFGYSAMFLAGILAVIYVILGVFTPVVTRPVSKTLTRMVYGVICFATLFSFVGTVLGGIWADQSWGRFWGWDPKENGALMIVLWCAILLHARWGGYIRERGIMAMAIAGNAITAFSWFGVNMLGVGLHSYGFMNKAFPWLLGFVGSQVLLVLLSRLPLRFWRSFRQIEVAKSISKPAEFAAESVAAP